MIVFLDLSNPPSPHQRARAFTIRARDDLGKLNVEMNSAMNATRRVLIARSATAVAARPATRVAALSTVAPSRNNKVRGSMSASGGNLLRTLRSGRNAVGCLSGGTYVNATTRVWDLRSTQIFFSLLMLGRIFAAC